MGGGGWGGGGGQEVITRPKMALLHSNQVKRTPQDYINELII